eukprot:CAMPEP_0173163684 /NCGR_PEP_ID=MMETSP1105-20130129/20070_1 /TAXON_ID=2985 /ORGANISM="Ochromonas sp., Strain BG-1" /LENGTH=141 /DNA_ID=CAMNT_0014083793 /DNA_START=113 /DNA_END=535 /DNA_ORIENTATION=-
MSILKASDILLPASTAGLSSPERKELLLKQRAAKRAQRRNQNMMETQQRGVSAGSLGDDVSQNSQLLSIHSGSNLSGNSGLTPTQIIERAQQRRIQQRKDRHRHVISDDGGPGISSARRLLEAEAKSRPTTTSAGQRERKG